MTTKLLLHEKRLVEGEGSIGIAELKVWEVPRSPDYPTGRKFRLFFVVAGETVIGMDNHKPKGPHVHVGDEEIAYDYTTPEKLINDFWEYVRKAGFRP